MALKILRFETTPNPNALKCILDGAISDRPRSFLNEAAAQEDGLASQLFAIDGVNNLLMNTDWMTVGKTPEADWKLIKKEVRRVLAGSEAPA